MGSNSKRLKLCSNNEDRISGMPDAVLCHILSFLSTREAVKTSVLSHRWKNVWASVPILDLDEQKYYLDYLSRHVCRTTRTQDPPRIRYDRDRFAQFVNRVLLLRFSGDIHRFRLVAKGERDISFVSAWIATAIKRNVVELDLTVGTTKPHFEIPKSLFMCSTLVRFKLWLPKDTRVMTPTSSNGFPSLKFLYVTVLNPDSDSMEKLFSRRFPVLEDLIIDGELSDTAAFNLDISAPKLQRLQIKLRVFKYTMIVDRDFVSYVCQIFVNVDAPNLEELDIRFDALVRLSLKNAKCLRRGNIGLFLQELENYDRFLGLADRIRQIFAGICDAKDLTIRAPFVAAFNNGHQHLLPTFNNLKYLELQLHTCRCLKSLTTVLNISPHLEHLKISQNWELYPRINNYCVDDNVDEFEHGWDAPETVPACLISHLKTIHLWDFKGCPDEMEVAKYLVKHGKALNRVIIHTPFSEYEEMKSQSPTALWSNFSKFPRGSKTCKIKFQIII